MKQYWLLALVVLLHVTSARADFLNGTCSTHPSVTGVAADGTGGSSKQKRRTVRKHYPELPPLPTEPIPQPGSNGHPYTLADLQKLAAENSPTLRQAISDVRAAKGALVQAKTYSNPTVDYQAVPTNNTGNAGAQGVFLDQDQHLTVAAAQKSQDNAKLALRRVRSDLSTNVRNAYFGLIVAQETMRANRALARFTDEFNRLYTGYLAAGAPASNEAALLRAQA
jgi:outer membrane protein TolC